MDSPLSGGIWLPIENNRRNQTCELRGIASQVESTERQRLVGTRVVLSKYIIC